MKRLRAARYVGPRFRTPALAVLSTLAVLACSGDRREPAEPMPSRPLSLARAVPTSGTPASPSPPMAPLGLEAFQPWLSLPELKAAAEALEAGDQTRAAREVEALPARRPLQPAEIQSYQMLLGRLREAAGDVTGAASAYELAAAAKGPLAGYAALGESRTLLASNRLSDAAMWASRVPPDQIIADDAELVAADAAQRAGDTGFATAIWERHLSRGDDGPEAPLLSLRLAETLVDSPRPPDAARDAELSAALAHVRKVLSRSADGLTMARAEAVQPRLLAQLSPAVRAERARQSPEEELERLKTLTDAKQYEVAINVANGLLARLGEVERWHGAGCEATLLRARALAGKKAWTEAEDALALAARKCEDTDVRARALFSAAKYATSTKRYVEAVGYYERLETECASHRLADDARLHRALCYREIGADARFTELLTRMPDDYPDGDMVLDGLFELALSRIEKGDWASAESVLDRAADAAAPADAKRGLERAGRERYFRARARAARSDTEHALADYESIVRELPLSYYMLQAYSRLAAADDARARHALDAGLSLAESDPFSFAHRPEFDLPGFVRALELLRVGDIQDATREMTALGVAKSDAAPPVLWAIALLYARAGAAKLSHDVTVGLSDWLGRWPAGDWQRAWEIAFPRPYRSLVQREAKRSAVAEALVYAVMREESSFDPAAESPVKAYGLMQLMEPTAQRFAKPLGLPSDPGALKRPAVNVALGCRVLSDLSRVFSESPLLAIPGYNAGAARPRRWLGERPAVDFDVWVELIPFQETRRYTKRVLASRAAYTFLYSKDATMDAMRLPITLPDGAQASLVRK